MLLTRRAARTLFLVLCWLVSIQASAQDGGAPLAIVPVGLDAGAVSPPAAIEVTVRDKSKLERTRESSDAVTVVDLSAASRQASDVGEVLARTEGINVRRLGGLGSDARFTLNGLSDDQIRFFVDDVPIELAGYVQGFANLPWLLLDQVVVYRGVVPIRFGADALGGAVNLITHQPTRGWGGEASYQVGSFGTHRATLSAFQVHQPTGIYGRVSLYLDSSRNDYRVDDVDVSDANGQVQTRSADAFHNGYRAFGGSLEVGVVKRPWAERLALRVFGMKLERELQTNLIQSASYGEARFDRASVGSTLRYQQRLARALRLEALAGYSFVPTHFTDDSRWVYNWLGQRVAPDPTPGETTSRPVEQTFWQHNSFARVELSWKLASGHDLMLAVMPTHVLRSGRDELRREGRDPLADQQQQLSIVSGLAYRLNVLDDLLENTLFAKSYVYRAQANQRAPNGTPIDRDRNVARFGVGDSVRVRITQSLYTKASYELATRLPRPDEVFGDGVLVNSNLTLKEETSHNGNLELTLRHQTERIGELRGSVNGFLRKIHNQIVLIGVARDARYQNVYGARSRGVETSAGW
ncbi:MAG TPA: TonB-dependent receptor plug domain-containing protein, partial [Polyangiales bacterium]|nr:TonB-dependent receptor plug domain-containing protein [Polyangiales bacterium]